MTVDLLLQRVFFLFFFFFFFLLVRFFGRRVFGCSTVNKPFRYLCTFFTEESQPLHTSSFLGLPVSNPTPQQPPFSSQALHRPKSTSDTLWKPRGVQSPLFAHFSRECPQLCKVSRRLLNVEAQLLNEVALHLDQPRKVRSGCEWLASGQPNGESVQS